MAPSDPLIQALLGEEFSYKNNPMFRTGESMAANQPYNPDGSFFDNFAAAGLTGLAGGLMQGFGRAQSQRDMAERAGELASAMPLLDDYFSEQDAEAKKAMLEAHPIIGEIAPLYQAAEQQRQQEQKQIEAKAQAEAEAAYKYEPPKEFTVGDQTKYGRVNPQTGQIEFVADLGGPRYKPGDGFGMPGTGGDAAEGADIDPFTAIQQRVPKAQRNMAIKELGYTTALKEGILAVQEQGKMFDTLGAGAYASLGPYSLTESAAKLKTINARFAGIASKTIKGNPSEGEALRQIEPFQLKATDSKEVKDAKIQGLTEYLIQNSEETPILNSLKLGGKDAVRNAFLNGGDAASSDQIEVDNINLQDPDTRQAFTRAAANQIGEFKASKNMAALSELITELRAKGFNDEEIKMMAQ